MFLVKQYATKKIEGSGKDENPRIVREENKKMLTFKLKK